MREIPWGVEAAPRLQGLMAAHATNEFVGVGIQPQVRAAPTIADLRAGRDTVLETALTLLRK